MPSPISGEKARTVDGRGFVHERAKRPPYKWWTFVHPKTGNILPIKVFSQDEAREDLYVEQGFLPVKPNVTSDSSHPTMRMFDEYEDPATGAVPCKDVHVTPEFYARAEAIKSKYANDEKQRRGKTQQGRKENEQVEIARAATQGMAQGVVDGFREALPEIVKAVAKAK